MRVVRLVSAALAGLSLAAAALGAQSPRRDSLRTHAPDTSAARIPGPDATRAGSPSDTSARAPSPLDSAFSMKLLGRLEFRGERTRDYLCLSNQVFSTSLRCRTHLTPELDFQFSLLSAGAVTDRVHVDVDYDSQREFDGSNNISIAYKGKSGEFLQDVDVGNVTFAPPPSHFITSGIPSGNYGVLASGQAGSMRISAIAAQQKGNVVQDQVFTIGARIGQPVARDIEDYQVEPRRFFFSVDPVLFGARYPDIDILDPNQMRALAASLPDSLRPARLFLYRLLIGGQPPNPNGPRFTLLGDPDSRPGQVYELLQEGTDYYVDPSLLWFALVQPLSLQNERLVVAYTLRIGGRDTTIARLGGTPDLAYTPNRAQYAHLVWDPRVSPGDPAFRREIRSVYRLGGDDVRRETVSLRVTAGTGADQEKPPGVATTYLQVFGLAQRTNSAAFDAENRLWPRPHDPNDLVSPTADAGRILHDLFIVFPSLEPFSSGALALHPTLVPNDTLYRTPDEYLYSPQHPRSVYRLRVAYEARGIAGPGAVSLGSGQLRPGSERLTLDGRTLIRGIDYDVDYDLGRVQLLTADTLNPRPQRLVVRYEENPLFTSVPTSILGLSSQWTLPWGNVAFTALSQSQRTTFTRPPLGYEPQGSLMAGLTTSLGWRLGGVSRGLAHWLPHADSAAPSRLDVQAELAVSQPRQSGSQQAYLASFEGEGGININLLASNWLYSSQPALGTRLAARLGASTLDTLRAATMAFQNFGTDADGAPVSFSLQQIDPRVALAGATFPGLEQILWLTLYPLKTGGLYDEQTGTYRWQVGRTVAGRRWRSVRTPLAPGGNGVDLTQGEQLVFWTLVDTTSARLQENPVLVFDFGDVSENSVFFAPESLRVSGTGAPGDSVYSGKQLQGFDVLNSERDPFSRAFSAQVNDLGLPGDVVDRLAVAEGASVSTAVNVPICQFGSAQVRRLGDARADCTAHNSRLDEEDIDQDNVLNFTAAQREQERVRRFIIDLGDSRSYNRVGTCGVTVNDANRSHDAGARLCWVQVRVPFNAPDDSTNGGPLLRRVRALRLTVVSGAAAPDDRFTLVPVTQLRVTGVASWLKRAARPLRGVGGEAAASSGGYVIATTIGTQDRDSTSGLIYDPPPGVSDQPEQQQTLFGLAGVPINETSLRLLAGDVPRYGRAEAYTRFPEGQRSVMTYRELRLWARGRGRGWGMNGDLEFFVKLGRDASNFYLYRTPISAGTTRSAWEPEIHVLFSRFYSLRAQLENVYARGGNEWPGCSAADSALIAASGLPAAGAGTRLAACDGGYMVYTVNAAVTPPNLNAVQEMAVGLVRVDSLRGADPPMAGDTLELWVDDIRLGDAVQSTGYAGRVAATFVAGDAGSLRFAMTRRDPNFRQLGEAPSFSTGDDLELSGTVRLDRALPARLGLAIPLTFTHTAQASDPVFLSNSDVRGSGIAGLRSPRGAVTTIALNMRRSTPMTGTWLAPLVNNLGLTVTWNGAERRSEFQRGTTQDTHVGLDYFFLRGQPATSDSAEGGAGLTPSAVRLSSDFERASQNVTAFAQPAFTPDDPAGRAASAQRLLRNGASVEFHPARDVTARWDAASLHDLRNYDGLPSQAALAGDGRSTVVGLDLGVERQRDLVADVLYAPVVAGWLRPRVELSSSYTMLRDPNAPVLLDAASGASGLANRFGNTQRASVSATLDPRRGLAPGAEEGSLASGLLRVRRTHRSQREPGSVQFLRRRHGRTVPRISVWSWEHRRLPLGGRHAGRERRRRYDGGGVELADVSVWRHGVTADTAHRHQTLGAPGGRPADADRRDAGGVSRCEPAVERAPAVAGCAVLEHRRDGARGTDAAAFPGAVRHRGGAG